MTVDAERIGETDLLAYVDGHLDPARRRAVEAWLAHHPDRARRVAADLAINQGIRRLFGDVYEQDVPPSLLCSLRQPPRWPLRRLLRRAAAALVLMASGAVGGWWLAVEEPMPPVGGLERLADGAIRPAVVSAGNAESLEVLTDTVRSAVRVPDLSSAGLRLVGQAAVGSTDRPVLQLTYEDGRGERVLLFVQLREAAETRFRYREGSRNGLLYWAEGPLVFALAADLPAADLRVLAELVHNTPARQRRAPLVPVAGGAPR